MIAGVGRIPGLGKAFRRIARLYREGSVVSIRSGPLAGYQWKRSHRYVNGYWLGIYELQIQSCLVRELRRGHVFYDVGANAGFFTLLGSQCVGPAGKVFSFEPLPENAASVRSQLELNAITNATVVTAAVTDCAGKIEFCQGQDTSTAHIRQPDESRQTTETLTVDAVTLDEFVRTAPAPDFIKMDIEGAELNALEGAKDLLGSANAPNLLIEFHGEDIQQQAAKLLTHFGYQFCSLEGIRSRTMPRDRHVLCVAHRRRDAVAQEVHTDRGL